MRIGSTAAALVVLLTSNSGLGNSIRPPAGHTGAAGEQNCQACHSDGPLNPDAGRLALEGLPTRYTPGQRYRLTVTLIYPKMDRAGFQLSTRFQNRSGKGEQAGELTSEDDRVEMVTDQENPIQFVQHSALGVELTATDQASWHFIWQAPGTNTGTVVINAAANGANYDDSEFGDAVFIQSWTVTGTPP